MSGLRILGLLAGLGCLAWVFIQLRSYKGSRQVSLLLALFGLALLLLSLFPGLADYPANLVSMSEEPAGRIITLLLFSNILLWLFAITHYTRNKTQLRKLENVSTELSVKEFLQTYPPLSCEAVCILIPAFNETDNIGAVLSCLPADIAGHPVVTLVVDDGSTDGTPEKAREFGALVATHHVNRGGGTAIKTGMAIARKSRPAVVITMDADGQHDPKEVASLAAPILADEADVVIGSRMLGGYDRYSSLRIAGVKFFSRLINILLNTRITDCASGYRAIRREVFERCILRQEQYHTAELIIEAAKRGFRIREVPIYIQARLSGESKKGSSLTYALGFFRSILRAWIR